MATPNSPPLSAAPGHYTVIARRYRPQTFEDLVGQEHVAQALRGAIETGRVGHAYLFTGARGVGKTSAARILAKALNCEQGPTPSPCNRCDICDRISVGEDVDVLEIDGASNRGIDEIRQLRQNVNVRPGRCRFKIYIIDEVHMLTREAFNALLKTLEEPPEHVKFIFCTTEPTKIPITILSRCQRFDFAGISWDAIAGRLRTICEAEGVEAEADALQELARRASGSMRDAQSLLEQLLAFAPGEITLAEVHRMLGTAGEERLCQLVAHLADRDAAEALADVDRALGEGVEVGLLVEQLLGLLRDCMAAAVGCPAGSFLYASPTGATRVAETAQRMGLETVLAVMQILDQTLARLRYSTHGRTLAELALVRICRLEHLDELPGLIAELRAGGGPPSRPSPRPARRQTAAAPAPVPRPSREGAAPEGTGRQAAPTAVQDVQALTPETATEVWNKAVGRLSGLVADAAMQYDAVTNPEPGRLVVSFRATYNFQRSLCQRPDEQARLEGALAEVTGGPVRIEFTSIDDEPNSPGAKSAARTVSPHQRLLEMAEHPLIRRAGKLFKALPTRVDEPPE